MRWFGFRCSKPVSSDRQSDEMCTLRGIYTYTVVSTTLTRRGKEAEHDQNELYYNLQLLRIESSPIN